MTKPNLEDLTSLCKRRGFIYQNSEIYGGLSGVWDWGPLGLLLKKNITALWWKTFVEDQDNVYGIETSILMNARVWQASGHLDTFNDPIVEDAKTKRQFRLDTILEDNGIDPTGMDLAQMFEQAEKKSIKSPDGNSLKNPTQFNTMFRTNIGPVEGEGNMVYLRPETAQGMFVNFKNIIDSYYPDLPFGLAQIGRNFRNEISPRDFVFRTRELEIMELEQFVHPDNWEAEFEKYKTMMRDWFINKLGLSKENIHEKELEAVDRAHYSKRTIDFEYKYPIGLKEIAGLAYRTDFDLKAHQEVSGKNLEYKVKGSEEVLIPHVIEPTFGVERHVLAVLSEAFKEDELNGEKRIYLDLPANLAPIKVAVSPLLKNKPELVKKARSVYESLKGEVNSVMWDDNGNIGKRYRRQDEIGTPICITIDFQTLDDDSVTLRDRNSAKQERVNLKDLHNTIKTKIKV